MVKQMFTYKKMKENGIPIQQQNGLMAKFGWSEDIK